MTTLEVLLASAAEQGAALNASFVGSEHLFLAWLVTADGAGHEAALAAGLTPDTFRALLAARAPAKTGVIASEGGVSSHAQRVLALAEEVAREDGRGAANADDVLLALVREPRGAVARALTEAKLKPSTLRQVMRPKAKSAPRPKREAPAEPSADGDAVVAPAARTPRPPRERPAAKAIERPAERPARNVRRDPEIDDIPEARAPARPRLQPPPRTTVAASEPARHFRWIWLLLIALPVSAWLHFGGSDPVAVFVVACVGIIPLASLISTSTEQIADRTNPMLGAVLNAAFGNATEVIVAIAALQAGFLDLVRASLVGSILGNLLLILGLAIFAGGTRHSILKFNRTAAGMSSAMLGLAVAGLILPSLLAATGGSAHALQLSRAVAAILAVTYLLSLFFTLKTHRAIFRPADHGTTSTRGWPVGVAVLVLALATVGVAFESEWLVSTISAVTASLHLSQLFLGLIVIPIIGNAAEHATAVVAARKGKIELAVQIAVGSSTQVALLVAPILVLIGALLGTGMDLVFPAFQVVALTLAVAVSAIITLDGESHWLEGAQLLALYAMIAVAAWFI